MNQDLDFLAEHVPEEEIREKYRENQPEYLRITDRDGQIIACPSEPPEEEEVVLSDSENVLGWKLEFIVDEKVLFEQILESQSYVVIRGDCGAYHYHSGQHFYLLQHRLSPIRTMSRTCHEINENRGSYRTYRFDAVRRRDEIGQLATTFELLLEKIWTITPRWSIPAGCPPPWPTRSKIPLQESVPAFRFSRAGWSGRGIRCCATA